MIEIDKLAFDWEESGCCTCLVFVYLLQVEGASSESRLHFHELRTLKTGGNR